jgi:hypothetical protein
MKSVKVNEENARENNLFRILSELTKTLGATHSFTSLQFI